MPICFQLTRKSDLKAGPVVLAKIDEEICEFLGITVHPDKWVQDWYNSIGLRLACGHSFEDIRTEFKKYIDESENDSKFYTRLTVILNFIDENFTTNSFYQLKF